MNPDGIRRGEVSDAEAIGNINAQSYRESYGHFLPAAFLQGIAPEQRAERWRRFLENRAEPNRFLYVVDVGQVVGYAAAGPARGDTLGSEAEIYALFLLQRAKRRGYGRALVKRLLNDLAASGFNSAGVWSFQANEPGCRFYEAMGAVAQARQVARYGDVEATEIGYRWIIKRGSPFV
jgi:GNAT superfamily N-acetyltransferase